jgi:hypothetical protein
LSVDVHGQFRISSKSFCLRTFGMSSSPDGIYTPTHGPGNPHPCMRRRPGNPRHLSVDVSGLPPCLGPPHKPLCGWPGYPAACGLAVRVARDIAQRWLQTRRGVRNVSGYPATQIPRGSGSPQPQPIGQTHLPSHPITIMCGVGVLLGLGKGRK